MAFLTISGSAVAVAQPPCLNHMEVNARRWHTLLFQSCSLPCAQDGGYDRELAEQHAAEPPSRRYCTRGELTLHR